MSVQQRETVNQVDQSYWSIVKRQFRKNRLAVWSLRFLMVIVVVGLLTDLIANDRPLVCKIEGDTYFPAFKEMVGGKYEGKMAFQNWYEIEYDFSVWPLIPYSPQYTDEANDQYVSPLTNQREVRVKADCFVKIDNDKNYSYATITYEDGSEEVLKFYRFKDFNLEGTTELIDGNIVNTYQGNLKEGDILAGGVKSMRWWHFLGTDQIGRDVLAGMVHGTRIAMMVGVVSMSISAFIGILLGSLAGYFGDQRLKVSRVRVFLNVIFLFFAYFYSFGVSGYEVGDSLGEGFGLTFVLLFLSKVLIFFAVMAIPNLLAVGLKKIPFLGKKITIPVDIFISRMIEIVISVPRLLLILSVVALLDKPSILIVMVIIGATSWTGIARFMRGELLKVRNLEYIEAAQALGYKEARIIFRHAIPNALTPVLITIAFGVASAILIESSLSFLGIGVEAEVMTWGKLLSLAREEFSAWWLAIFPGFAIFITVTIFNLLGEGLTDALDPRLKK